MLTVHKDWYWLPVLWALSQTFCNDFLLQTLYAAMHEPDGVRGVNALRREEPSLREQILEHESIGLLRDATACYDRAIQLESDQVQTHKTLLRSFNIIILFLHLYFRFSTPFLIPFFETFFFSCCFCYFLPISSFSLSLCEQIGHYHGVMTSMLGLGQLSTVITQVNGVLANK